MSEQPMDLVVIGSGPGGYVAAIRAAQLGLRTALVEKDPQFGGTCLHRGCIPTKALLHTASVYEGIAKSEQFGVSVLGGPTFDGEQALTYRRSVISKNANGVAYLLKKNGVETVHGHGSLDARERKVNVRKAHGGEQQLHAKNVLVATGSVPRELPFAPTNGKTIINSDHALEMTRVPESVIVLGAGAVGCEFASIYASLGAKVTLVELMPAVLPQEDSDVQAEAARTFKRRGIDVLVGTQLQSVSEVAGGVRAVLNKEDAGGQSVEVAAEQLLVAVGRQPVTQNLGLEAIGVQLDEGGFVAVDEWMESASSGVYAIGDVVRTPWLAHVASAEGILVAERLAKAECQPIDYDLVPSCTYCDPEVGSVGLTEAQAEARGYDVSVGKFPFTASGKASILGKTEGFVKVVREKRYDQLLGVHIIGAHATDLIAEACVALRIESTTEELFRTMHAHPTLSEAVSEAAQVALGRALHA